MCLSSVYLGERSERDLLLKEASQVAETEQGVQVSTLFGDSRLFEDCAIHEVNMLDNFVVLRKRSSANG